MINRFSGERGRQVLIDALCEQKLVAGNRILAERIAGLSEPSSVPAGTSLIEQGASGNDVFLLITGSFDIIVNGRQIAKRWPGDHVGEMAAIQPTLRRSASVRASEDSVIVSLTEAQLSELAMEYPQIWRVIARELARRLEQRNRLVNIARDRIQVFIISSVEALPIARAIQNAFAHDPFNVTVWTDGVFRASGFPLTSLEAAVDQSDFAIAIVQPDDVVTVRDRQMVVPRDNVIFELGLFIGRLGIRRSFLLEPRAQGTKLPSDLIGVTTVGYHLAPSSSSNRQALATALAPACNEIRDIIDELGPNN
jgi:predicted nucleotide-binding protein